MCLSLGDTSQMLKPVVPPTPKAIMWRGLLTALGFVHISLAIMYLFCNLMQGIYEVIIVAVLFCSLASVNFCCLTVYMIYITMNFFTMIGSIGLAIQNRELDTVFDSKNSPLIFQFSVTILLCIFDVIALVVCFFAYREFKGMLFDHGGASQGSIVGGMPGTGSEQVQYR